MAEILELLRLLISIKDNPVLIVSVLAFGALILAGWAIYAVTLALKQNQKR